MQTSRCPNCNSDVIVEDDLSENDLVSCANCATELEIISKSPLQLASLNGALDNQDEVDEANGQSQND